MFAIAGVAIPESACNLLGVLATPGGGARRRGLATETRCRAYLQLAFTLAVDATREVVRMLGRFLGAEHRIEAHVNVL